LAKFNFDKARIRNSILNKTPNDSRTGKEVNVWVIIDGKKRFRIQLPKGRGQCKEGTANSIFNQSKLDTPDEFKDLIKCPMTGTDYVRKIIAKVKSGLI